MDTPIDCHLTLTQIEGNRYQLRLAVDDPAAPGEQLLLGQPVHVVTLDLDRPEIISLEPLEQGKWLARTIFAAPVAQQALGRLLARIEESAGPIRFRLECDSSLFYLPWEALDLDGLGPISLRERVRFSRYLGSSSERPVSPPPQAQLRAVVAVAAPGNLVDYALAPIEPHRYFNQARNNLPGAIVLKAAANLEAIRRQIEVGTDILYLVAHGRFGKQGPILYLEDEAGQVVAVGEAQLASWLANIPVLPRLVVLVSCESAGQPNQIDASPLNALGPRLVAAGVPAVLAMQGKLTVETAGQLMPTFLAELASDGCLDRALATARRRVSDRFDAWMPVLFSRSRDGYLWPVSADGMLPGLPATLAHEYNAFTEEFIDFLWQYCWTQEARQLFLMEAIGVTSPKVMRRLDPTGDADSFLRRTLTSLLAIDCQHVEALILAGRRRKGVQADLTVAQLQTSLKEICSSYGPTTHLPPSFAIDKGIREATLDLPTVFLSYADDDAREALELRRTLTPYGYVFWTDRPDITNDDEWTRATEAGLAASHTVIVLVGATTHQNRWVQAELLGALDKQRRIIPLRLAGSNPLPPVLADDAEALLWDADSDPFTNELLARLPDPDFAPVDAAWHTLTPDLTARADEFAYMGRLKFRELRYIAQYTQLSGRSRLERAASGRARLRPTIVGLEHRLLPWQDGEGEVVEERSFTDAVLELRQIRRAVLLGRPGAGKTTTLFRLAADLIDEAYQDTDAAVPLLVRLGLWTKSAESFTAFLARQADELGDTLAGRLETGRIALLLDGLNEIPTDQQAAKYGQIRQFLSRWPELLVILSCRTEDYPREQARGLLLNQVIVQPLNPVQVFRFIEAHLQTAERPELAPSLYWQLISDRDKGAYARLFGGSDPINAEELDHFWHGDDWPDEKVDWTWRGWLRRRDTPQPLLQLAANPYMLYMMVNVALQREGQLPGNRGRLFDQFVAQLLVREGLWQFDKNELIWLDTGNKLMSALTELAFAMQTTYRDQGAEGGAATAVPRRTAQQHLASEQLRQAVSASLLVVGAEVRFSHQLLQEYFVARALRERIWPEAAGEPPLLPQTIWPPESWWEPTGWEEAVILLAGLESTDCSRVVNWLAEANPELAARCIVESDAFTPEPTKLALRDLWLPRLTDLKRDPDPKARAAVGRALGRVRLADGMPLDNRAGCGLCGSRKPEDTENCLGQVGSRW